MNEPPAAISRLIAAGSADRSHNFCGCGFSIGGFMNENDRTTLEQAIYEEMELTPEMIRSIRTLCGVCLCSFVESKAFKIAIVPSADRSMDTCTVCQTRRGHDYVVMNR